MHNTKNAQDKGGIQRRIAKLAISAYFAEYRRDVPRQFVLRQVRQLMPQRPLSAHEAENVAERQAFRLLELLCVTAPPVDLDLVAGLPGLDVQVRPRRPPRPRREWCRRPNGAALSARHESATATSSRRSTGGRSTPS